VRKRLRRKVDAIAVLSAGYNVLVASDAIGMGLNLNIRRIVFSEIAKFNGTETVILSPAQVKQIAGRAGRAKSQYPEGYVTTFADADMPLLEQCMKADNAEITCAGLSPNTDQVVQFASSWKSMHGSVPGLSRLLSNFIEASQLDGDYFMCDAGGVSDAAVRDVGTEHAAQKMEIAQAIEGVENLSLQQQHDLTAAPVRVRDPEVRAWFLRYAQALAENKAVPVDVQLPLTTQASPRLLDILETRMAVSAKADIPFVPTHEHNAGD
jgi:ATP-dependent RNA helicase SUPV3L1/SUV3